MYTNRRAYKYKQVIMARLFMEDNDDSWRRVLQEESKACAAELADACILNNIAEFAHYATQQKTTTDQMYDARHYARRSGGTRRYPRRRLLRPG